MAEGCNFVMMSSVFGCSHAACAAIALSNLMEYMRKAQDDHNYLIRCVFQPVQLVLISTASTVDTEHAANNIKCESVNKNAKIT